MFGTSFTHSSSLVQEGTMDENRQFIDENKTYKGRQADGGTRGLQNITNRLANISFSGSEAPPKRNSTGTQNSDSGSWLTGKPGVTASIDSDTQNGTSTEALSKYALAQPPSGAPQMHSCNFLHVVGANRNVRLQ